MLEDEVIPGAYFRDEDETTLEICCTDAAFEKFPELPTPPFDLVNLKSGGNPMSL